MRRREAPDARFNGDFSSVFTAYHLRFVIIVFDLDTPDARPPARAGRPSLRTEAAERRIQEVRRPKLQACNNGSPIQSLVLRLMSHVSCRNKPTTLRRVHQIQNARDRAEFQLATQPTPHGMPHGMPQAWVLCLLRPLCRHIAVVGPAAARSGPTIPLNLRGNASTRASARAR